MHYLVDGYNFLFYAPLFQDLSQYSLKNAQISNAFEFKKKRQALIAYLGELAMRSHFSLTVIFDSPKSESYLPHDRYNPIEVVYSPFGMSADDWILESLTHRVKNAPTCAVTNDKRLQAHIHRAHQSSISIEEFLERASRRFKREKKEKKPPLPPRLIHYYTEIFERRYRKQENLEL